MKPLIEPIIIKRENEKMQQGYEQGLQQRIRSTISIMRSSGCNDTEIENIMKGQYTLTEEEIKGYMVI